MVDWKDEVVYKHLPTFPTPWRNFIGLLVTHFEESTIYFNEKHICHLGHYMVAVGRKKSHLAVLESMAFRIVPLEKEL